MAAAQMLLKMPVVLGQRRTCWRGSVRRYGMADLGTSAVRNKLWESISHSQFLLSQWQHTASLPTRCGSPSFGGKKKISLQLLMRGCCCPCSLPFTPAVPSYPNYNFPSFAFHAHENHFLFTQSRAEITI